jgi:hypothetical protein
MAEAYERIAAEAEAPGLTFKQSREQFLRTPVGDWPSL